jgi:hypothetical protein
MQYGKMSVPELRNHIRNNMNTRETWVASASKSDCLRYIHQGKRPMPTAEPPVIAPAPAGDASSQLGALIQQIAGSSVNEERVRALIHEETKNIKPHVTRFVIPNKPDYDLKGEVVHSKTPALLALLQLGPVWMHGPSGSGKTTGAKKAADILGLPFYAMSASTDTTKGDLFGYTKPSDGSYKDTPLFNAYTKGGVMLLDEADNLRPSLFKMLKMVMGSSKANFDGQIVDRHEDFKLIVAANTTGGGRDAKYVSAIVQDSATVDEFGMLNWDYCYELERNVLSKIGLDDAISDGLHKLWLTSRMKIDEQDKKILATPRSLFMTATAIKAGLNVSDAIKTYLTSKWGGKDAIMQAIGSIDDALKVKVASLIP